VALGNLPGGEGAGEPLTIAPMIRLVLAEGVDEDVDVGVEVDAGQRTAFACRSRGDCGDCAAISLQPASSVSSMFTVVRTGASMRQGITCPTSERHDPRRLMLTFPSGPLGFRRPAGDVLSHASESAIVDPQSH